MHSLYGHLGAPLPPGLTPEMVAAIAAEDKRLWVQLLLQKIADAGLAVDPKASSLLQDASGQTYAIVLVLDTATYASVDTLKQRMADMDLLATRLGFSGPGGVAADGVYLIPGGSPTEMVRQPKVKKP